MRKTAIIPNCFKNQWNSPFLPVYAPFAPSLPMHVEPSSRPQFCRLLAPYTVQKCTHTRFEQYVFVVWLWLTITSHLAQCLAFNPLASSWSESYDCTSAIGLFKKVFPTMFLSWRWNWWIRIAEVVGSFTKNILVGCLNRLSFVNPGITTV